MPGYRMTPARRAALKRAQEISARKRRKWHSDHVRRRRRRAAVAVGAVGAVGAAAAVGVALVAQKKYQNKKANDKWQKDHILDINPKTEAQIAAQQAEIDRLTKIAGNHYGPCESQEQYEARQKLYGQIIGEDSKLHGRPEIFPGRPEGVVLGVFAREMNFPSYRIDTSGEYTVMYHRTGGGSDHDAEKAAEEIIRTQKLKILNRDEKRAISGASSEAIDNHFQDVWMSNKLNDSNTRAAFGEVVIKVTIPKAAAEQMKQQSFGQLSPGEVWGAIHPDLLVGATFERVPPEEITPVPEKKFRVPNPW